jgi:hypothetical protein
MSSQSTVWSTPAQLSGFQQFHAEFLIQNEVANPVPDVLWWHLPEHNGHKHSERALG